MTNTIEDKWWKRWFRKMNHIASYIVTPSARERYKTQQDFAENKTNGTTKTNETGKD